MIKPIFEELADATTEAPFHGRHLRRRHAPQPADRHRLPDRTSGRRGPGGLLRARLGRDGRSQQGLGQDHRREHGPVRPGLLRVRLQEVGVDHGVAPAFRAAAHPLDVSRRGGRLRRLPPVRHARPHQGPRIGQAWRDIPAQRPVRPGRGLGPPARRRPAPAHRQGDRLLGDRCAGGRRRGGDGQPDQHRHATVLLQARRDPAARGGHRADQGLRPEDLRQARRGGRRAQLRGDRPLARASRARDARSCHQRTPTTRRSPTMSPTSWPGSPRD